MSKPSPVRWPLVAVPVVIDFPEFNPPNCSNCGKGVGNLEVDYQDTSTDFWPLANAVKPVGIITFSRGSFGTNWEVERNQFNWPSWVNDYLAPFQPTPVPPDRSVPANTLRLSTLPTQAIVDAVNSAQLGISAFICFAGNGGRFLSEFIAYHGVWYQSNHRSPADPDWCIAGGHVHIGTTVTWQGAEQAAHITLRTLIADLDAVRGSTVQQPDLGFGGPGPAMRNVAGAALATGGQADLLLYDAAPNAAGFLLVGPTQNPVPLFGGTLVPNPPVLLAAITTSESGRFAWSGIMGGGGPATLFAQAIHLDMAQAMGVSYSNAVQLNVLP